MELTDQEMTLLKEILATATFNSLREEQSEFALQMYDVIQEQTSRNPQDV